MANPNYILLETITVGEAGASSVTFNNIPQTGYTDLKIVVSARTNGADTPILMYFNTDTTDANYTVKRLFGSGSAASSAGYSAPYAFYADVSTYTSNTFNNNEIYIPNYSGANKKSFSVDSVNENNATGADMALTAGLWSGSSGTSAITAIKLNTVSGSFVQYSTFSLYGLAAVGTTPVIAPYASGGDIIQTDGTYWYHAFLSSGTFTPAKGLSCDVLVVAGGGSGGLGNGAGGGGAGGLLTASSQLLTSGASYTCTIGAGGSANGVQSPGSNSLISGTGLSTITATGGGNGMGEANTTGNANGGSGGGGSYNRSPGTGISGQGYGGGTGQAGTNGSGAGGGGAGAVGGNGVAQTYGGNGGNGIYSTLTDAIGAVTGLGQLSSGHYYFAGGGGGAGYHTVAGTGGLGGGGAAGLNPSTPPTPGTPNTGGGGGARDTGSTNSANGGSGVIVLRYAI